MALTTIGGTTNFTRDDDGYWTGRVEKWDFLASALSSIPANGTAYGGTEPWAATELRRVEFQYSENGSRGHLILTYSDAPFSTSGGGGNPSQTEPDDSPVYRLESRDELIPLNRVDGYRAIWDHDLYVRKASDGSYDIGAYDWAAATTTEIADTGYADRIRWVQDSVVSEIDSEGYRWGLYRRRTKPGTDGLQFFAPVIVETRWFSNSNSAGTFACGATATLVAPGETFGLSPSTSAHFLVAAGPVQPDGNRWQGERRYIWSLDEWDSDLYPWSAPA